MGLGASSLRHKQRRGTTCHRSHKRLRGPVGVTVLHIDGNLVRYLRKGVLQQMSAALEVIQTEVDQNQIDVRVYGRALARFDEARTLFEIIGFDARTSGDRDIDLDGGYWRPLVIKALENQYTIELSRLDDAAAAGVTLMPRDVLALGKLVEELKEPNLPPRHRRPLLRWPRPRSGA